MDQKENNWKLIQKYIKNQFNIPPNVHNILFLIGIQELGYGFQHLDQAEKTKVINFASIYIMNFIDKKEKSYLKNQASEKDNYEEEIYKKGIINYFKTKKIL